MCEAVIVVETDVSGGSMITAKFAGEQGRLIFAVPGRIDQPSSAGCHQLIRDGATLLTSVDDVLSEMNYLGGLRPAAIGKKDDEDESPAPEGLSADEAAGQTGLAMAQLSPALMMLELKRMIAKRADGSFEARN
jgi:DNA processing protein